MRLFSLGEHPAIASKKKAKFVPHLEVQHGRLLKDASQGDASEREVEMLRTQLSSLYDEVFALRHPAQVIRKPKKRATKILLLNSSEDERLDELERQADDKGDD
jgi:hypothetical protein